MNPKRRVLKNRNLSASLVKTNVFTKSVDNSGDSPSTNAMKQHQRYDFVELAKN